MLAANLMVMLLLKRGDVPLDRDVIFLSEAGEEADPTGVGINSWWPSISTRSTPSSAITEGGGATLENGTR